MYYIAYPTWNWAIEWKKTPNSEIEIIEEDGDNKPVLLQDTWLKDKNWKSIYEWDVVLYNYFERLSELSVVSYFEWWWYWIDGCDEYLYKFIDKNTSNVDIKIIWNIYELSSNYFKYIWR